MEARCRSDPAYDTLQNTLRRRALGMSRPRRSAMASSTWHATGRPSCPPVTYIGAGRCGGVRTSADDRLQGQGGRAPATPGHRLGRLPRKPRSSDDGRPVPDAAAEAAPGPVRLRHAQSRKPAAWELPAECSNQVMNTLFFCTSLRSRLSQIRLKFRGLSFNPKPPRGPLRSWPRSRAARAVIPRPDRAETSSRTSVSALRTKGSLSLVISARSAGLFRPRSGGRRHIDSCPPPRHLPGEPRLGAGLLGMAAARASAIRLASAGGEAPDRRPATHARPGAEALERGPACAGTMVETTSPGAAALPPAPDRLHAGRRNPKIGPHGPAMVARWFTPSRPGDRPPARLRLLVTYLDPAGTGRRRPSRKIIGRNVA